MRFNPTKNSKLNTDTTLKSLYDLVEYATDFRFKRNANHRQLHIALIENFFNTSCVVLDEDNNRVYLGLDTLSKGLEIEVIYTNLTSFLKSCIRNTPENREFYNNILHYYSKIEAVA